VNFDQTFRKGELFRGRGIEPQITKMNLTPQALAMLTDAVVRPIGEWKLGFN